ncbi:MAG: aminopeptidase P family protein [Methylobacteriaceae bacterium]|nr:aminopeptidase P family protein [Methylobacteriaceae bacterium]
MPVFESRLQSFAVVSDPATVAPRLAALRAELKRRGLDGFVAPRADEHQNEYVQKSAERLAWLTGFTGSAGLAVALADKAALFVDGRYTLQAKEQTDAAAFAIVHLIETPPERWLEANAAKGARIGYDPWLMTRDQVARLAKGAQAAGASLVALDDNPVDAVWSDRPAPPPAPVTLHPPKYAGESAAKKIARLRKTLGKLDALAISDPHSVAWLFNIRGGDVGCTPLPLAWALVAREGKPRLYVDGRKLSNAVRAKLADLADVEEPRALLADLERLGRDGATVRFDSTTAPEKLAATLEAAGGKADVGADPTALMKAAKNRAELDGARAAHLRDGAALTRFLAWFDAHARKGALTEIDAAAALESFRRETGKLKDLSFPSISAAGPNAALPHYRVNERSNRVIGRGVYLIDSGAQYEDGTTDVTRTLAVGRPTAEMRDRATRVLKGHIAIAMAVFPKGTTGAQLDTLARESLWRAGLDFDHGTGHGVGSYLSVHEGPQRIAKTGTTPLVEGMIISNEPGYYRPGHFGVRLENLVVVEKRVIAGAEREMLGFETLTLAPFDLALIDNRLLTRFEVAWLDAYHARVRKALSPLLDAPTRKWLAQATRKISNV